MDSSSPVSFLKSAADLIYKQHGNEDGEHDNQRNAQANDMRHFAAMPETAERCHFP
jgi:hypothetical protein